MIVTNVFYQQIKGLVSRDNYRPAIQHVLYVPDESRIYATNGHAAAFWKVDPEEGDARMLLSPRAFRSMSRRKSRAIRIRPAVTVGPYSETADVEAIYENDEVSYIPLPDYGLRHYPLCDDAFPGIREVWAEARNQVEDLKSDELLRIGVNLSYLNVIAAAIPKDSRVVMQFSKANRAIVIDPAFSPNGIPAFGFLLMPVLLDPCEVSQ